MVRQFYYPSHQHRAKHPRKRASKLAACLTPPIIKKHVTEHPWKIPTLRNTLEKYPEHCGKWLFKIQNYRNENEHSRQNGVDTLENSSQNHKVLSTFNDKKIWRNGEEISPWWLSKNGFLHLVFPIFQKFLIFLAILCLKAFRKVWIGKE